MSELPEVETALRGVGPHITGKAVSGVILRQSKLRWPVNPDLPQILQGLLVEERSRRARYLIIRFQTGVLLIYLGMSGSLRVLTMGGDHVEKPDKRDHIDIELSDGTILRYHDPRKFGAFLWFEGVVEYHPLLAKLGPEPLSDKSDADYLHRKMKVLKRTIKSVLMDNTVVVGVGNICANESLFKAGIVPHRPAYMLSRQEYTTLVEAIKTVLKRAIETGGSTLRDFVNSDGQGGYFQQEYAVYDRQGKPCVKCGKSILKEVLGQCGAFHCSHRQK